jgi:plasmid stabilization system protein ParE
VRLLLLRSAIEDLARGRQFYEFQGKGLGDYFHESLAADIESLRLYAGIHSKSHGYYRMLADRFPYAVYYDIEQDSVRIRAVLACRRDPEWIRARLIG